MGADIDFGVSRSGHPLVRNDLDEGLLFAGRSGGDQDVHDTGPNVDGITTAVAVTWQLSDKALIRVQLLNPHDVGNLVVDGRQAKRLSGAKLHEIRHGILVHVLEIFASRGGKIGFIKVPKPHEIALGSQTG